MYSSPFQKGDRGGFLKSVPGYCETTNNSRIRLVVESIPNVLFRLRCYSIVKTELELQQALQLLLEDIAVEFSRLYETDNSLTIDQHAVGQRSVAIPVFL